MAQFDSQPYADFINEHNPDFVCLQEVDYKTLHNGKRDFLNEVAMKTGMFPIFFQSMPYWGGGYGTAILSRYPFYRSYSNVFPKYDKEKEPRACGWVYVQLPSGQKIRVVTVHLALMTPTATVNNINFNNKELFKQDSVIPTLMVGDFNAQAGSDPINYCKKKWDEMCPGIGFTIPADKPAKQLDFVMGYPKGSWTCKPENFKIYPRPDLSDHCFLVVDVDLKK